MLRIFLAFIIILFGLGMIGNGFGQEIYRWVDKKGTVHFSDNPTSGVFHPQEKRSSKENTNEILKGIETGNRRISKDQYILNYQKGTDVGLAGKGRRKFLKK